MAPACRMALWTAIRPPGASFVGYIDAVHLPFLVGIQEDKVKRPVQLGHLDVGVSLDQGDPLGKAGLGHVASGKVVSPRIDFDRGQPSARLLKREPYPNSGSPVRRADLQDTLHAGEFYEEVEDFAVLARHTPIARCLSVHLAQQAAQLRRISLHRCRTSLDRDTVFR